MYDFWEGQFRDGGTNPAFYFRLAASAREVFLAIKSRAIIATLASKFMANTAFEACLLLEPSHQRTVWTVNKA
jgi:hypothetical protein